MYMTKTKHDIAENQRCWSTEKGLAIVRETCKPGRRVSMVARQRGLNPNQLVHWRKGVVTLR